MVIRGMKESSLAPRGNDDVGKRRATMEYLKEEGKGFGGFPNIWSICLERKRKMTHGQ